MNQHPSADDRLLDKLTEAIEGNLQNEQFGVPELAEAAGLSKSQLNRRLGAITGQSASQFIREYRLKKAMELLQSKAATPTEVAYSVGFNNPSYFSTCFKEFYGYSPGEVKFRESNQYDTAPTKNSKKSALLAVGIIALIVLTYFSFRGLVNSKHSIGKKNTQFTIAVLPYEFHSNDSTKHQRALAVAEGISTKLSKVNQIKMIDKHFLKSIDPTEVAEKFGADLLLSINFVIDGENFNLFVNISGTKDHGTIWSESYENRPLTNAQAVQSEVVQAITNELGIKITQPERAQINHKVTQNDKAYAYYLLGSDYLARLQSEENMRNASELFEKAIALDSGFANAWVGLYSANRVLYSRHHNRSKEQYEKVQYYREKARQLNPEHLNWKVNSIYDMEKTEALQTLQDLLKKHPNNDTIYKKIGAVYNSMEQYEKALENVEKAIEINPGNFHHYAIAAINCNRLRKYNQALEYRKMAVDLGPEYHWGQLATDYLKTGNIEKARAYLDQRAQNHDKLAWYRSRVEMYDRNFQKALMFINEEDTIIFKRDVVTKFTELGLIYFAMGDFESAKKQFQSDQIILTKMLEASPENPAIFARLGICYAGLGMKTEAIKQIEKAVELIDMHGGLGQVEMGKNMARIYLMMGDYEKSVETLEFVLDHGMSDVAYLELHPFWDPLRDREDFQALIKNPKYAPVS